jgi:AcrR family transcriptional regulator
VTDRQKQIVEMAIKLTAEHGIQSVTIKNLAKEIGVSEPALYRHFKSKFDILNAVIDYFIMMIKPTTKELDKMENSIEAIRILFNNHLKIFEKNNNLARIIFSESNFKNDDRLLRKIKNLMETSMERILTVIKKGQQNGQIRKDIQPVSIFRMIIGSLRLLVTQWSISKMEFDLLREGQMLCEDILKVIRN